MSDKWTTRIIGPSNQKKSLYVYGLVEIDSKNDIPSLVLEKNDPANRSLHLKLKIERVGSEISPDFVQIFYCLPNYQNQFSWVYVEYPNKEIVKLSVNSTGETKYDFVRVVRL